jgi:hypothetical protein
MLTLTPYYGVTALSAVQARKSMRLWEELARRCADPHMKKLLMDGYHQSARTLNISIRDLLNPGA